jgi:hypothetical protein
MKYVLTRKLTTTETYVVEAKDFEEAKSFLKFDQIPLEVNTKTENPELKKVLDDDEYMDWLRERCPDYWDDLLIEGLVITGY